VFVRQCAVDTLLAVVDRFNRVTFRLKIFSYQLAKADVVVNYKNVLHWLLYSKIERHMDDLRQVAAILHESAIFVRKEVSIVKSAELTKLYKLLTDSLRPISIQSAPPLRALTHSIRAN
jgi:hypothetical protein